MCGIVGYIGNKSAVSVLMVGLTKLEYRGYDSAGVAVHDGSGVLLRREVGKLRVLELTESYTPFVVSVPLQLLAYHVANARGCDVDQPRNLAKSVTVE